MKTHFKKLKNPNYLGSWDLADENGIMHDKVFTITKVGKDQVHDGKGGQDECVVISLKEAKPLIANSTNLKTISSIYGNYIEDWAGQKIKVTVKRIKAFGDFHDALRVVKEKIEKLEFTPASKTWDSAKASIKAGNLTIEQLQNKYTISNENIKKLQD